MWSTEESSRFILAAHYAGKGDYRGMLRVAERLLKEVVKDPAKVAYVLGCRKAVALRHLGHTRQADRTFNDAYEMALGVEEQAIASYILNDWASVLPADKAVKRIDDAIALRTQAKKTPDPTRGFAPDIAYFEAHKARMLARLGKREQAASLIASAKAILKRYSHNQAYQNAYLVVLAWELEMHNDSWLKQLWLAPSVLTTVIRQGKLKEMLKLLKSRQKRQQVRFPEE